MIITHWLRVVHFVAVLISYWNAESGLIVVMSSYYTGLIISSIKSVHIEKSKGLPVALTRLP